MKPFLAVMLFFSCITSFGQTKLISHKSHSGSEGNFAIAVENNLFDIGNSNFGDPPHRMIKKFTIDSVVYLENNKAVIISSEKITREYLTYQGESIKNKDSLVFTGGRDTVANHPLFSKRHSLDSIRHELLYTDNGKAVFVGYDNNKQVQEKQKQEKKKGQIAVGGNSNDGDFPSKSFLTGVLALAAILLTLISYRNYKKQILLQV